MTSDSFPVLGSSMSEGYLRALGQVAYLWGWPLVNMHNRRLAFSKVPEPGLTGGVMPCGPLNEIGMLHDYVSPDQKFVACPNQDVVYGFGILSLDLEPAVVQVPEMGDRFWVYQLGDQRTDSIGGLGKPHGSLPGHHLVVGPTWAGDVPAGIVSVLRSSTDLAYCIPRVFLDDTAADRVAVQAIVNQVSVYPLSRFDGTMQSKDWTNLPSFPGPADAGGEIVWVHPETFFDVFAAVLDEVPPLTGEEALYSWFRAMLAAAAADPALQAALVDTAITTERDVVRAIFHWSGIGLPIGNGWTSPANGAAFGTDYLTRLAVARTNIFVNPLEETRYFYSQADETGAQLVGDQAYTVTFPAGSLPPVRGFWSMTLYNEEHFFATNDLVRYSLGTKNRDLQLAPDGSLTLYVQSEPPAEHLRSNWLPSPAGSEFSLYVRTYWPEKVILDGGWAPPAITRSAGS